jgi:hypothetical protein
MKSVQMTTFIRYVRVGVMALMVSHAAALEAISQDRDSLKVTVTSAFAPDAAVVNQMVRAAFAIDIGEGANQHVEEKEKLPSGQTFVVTFDAAVGSTDPGQGEVRQVVVRQKGGKKTEFVWPASGGPQELTQGDFVATRKLATKGVVTIASTIPTALVEGVDTSGKFDAIGEKRIKLDAAIVPPGAEAPLKGGAETLGVVIRVWLTPTPQDFIPKGGDEDNTVRFTATVEPATVVGGFTFSLSNVSSEPGYCLNAPLKLPTAKKEDSADWNDLQFRAEENAAFDVPGDSPRGIAKTKTKNHRQVAVVVTSFDYGGYGTIRATFEAAMDTARGNKPITGTCKAVIVGTETDQLAEIPRDANGNKIADAATMHDTGPSGTNAAIDDLDSSPVGADGPGDLVSRYEEYRGFMVQGAHVRTDPAKKDVFYCDFSNIAHQDHWTEANLGAPIHKITRDQMDRQKVVNFNSKDGTAHIAEQLAIKQEIPPKGHKRPFFWGASSIAPPRDAEYCYVYPDEKPRGVRSATTLARGLTANATDKFVVNIQSVADPGWEAPGRVMIEGELIEYQTVAKDGATYVMSRLTRGANKMLHKPGALVPYFVNPDEVLSVAVPHECGHDLAIHHDETIAGSLMDGHIKAGTFQFKTQFRHEGVIQGSTQEFRIK